MEKRQRTITLPSSEKLDNMSRDGVEQLMRDLGEMGLEPILREKNIPPELLTLTEAGKEKLSTLNYREYIEIVQSLGLEMGEHTPHNFWRTISFKAEGVILRAEEPLYDIDMAQFLKDYSEAEGRKAQGTVMDRHADNLRKSFECLDPLVLIKILENGELLESENIGKKMMELATSLANHLIRNANQDARVD